MIDVGKNIRIIRESRNMTQEELANRLFVSRQTVSNYETGRTKPDIEMLARLAEILNTDIHDLIYGTADIQRRSKMLTRFFIAMVVVLVMLICWDFLIRWAMEIKAMKYIVVPTFLLNVFYKPVMLFCIGWTFMQGIGTFYQLRTVKASTGRRIKLAVFLFAAAYLIITGPLVLSVVYRFPIPLWWSHLAYWVLGALSERSSSPVYLGVAFILGAFFWMSGAETSETFCKKV